MSGLAQTSVEYLCRCSNVDSMRLRNQRSHYTFSLILISPIIRLFSFQIKIGRLFSTIHSQNHINVMSSFRTDKQNVKDETGRFRCTVE